MQYVTNSLLEDLFGQAEQFIQQAVLEWQMIPASFFTRQPSGNQWSATQCLAHLNSYGNYYLPAMELAIARAAGTKPAEHFTSGWLGNYFYNMMLTNGKGQPVKRMKAPRNHRPAPQLNHAPVMETFISQLEKLEKIIESSAKVNLEKARVPISIAPMIRLKLGDVLLFYVAHIHRHLLQADRALVAAGYLPESTLASLKPMMRVGNSQL
jgi:DinB superfamily